MNYAAQFAALVRSVAHGLVVVADDSLGDESSEVVLGAPADTLDGEGDVRCTHGVIANTDIRANEVSGLLGKQISLVRGPTAGKTREVLLGQLNKLLMGNTAGSDKDHAVRGIVVLDVVGKLGSGDVADVLARAQNGTAQGLPLEGSSVQMVENNLLNLLLNLLRFAQDDVALTLNGRLLEFGVLQDVGQDIDALRNIGIEGLGEVNGILAL